MPNSSKYDTALRANVSIEYGGVEGGNKQKKNACGGESLQKTIVHNSKFSMVSYQKITNQSNKDFFFSKTILYYFASLVC